VKGIEYTYMSKYTYRNISNTFFLVFLACGSILKCLHCTKSVLFPPRGTTQKNHVFKQPVNYRVWILIPRPNTVL